MIIVSDTSPLSNLFIIKRLDLLHNLYGTIIIPHAVFEELLALKSSGFDLSEIEQATWIEIKRVAENSDLKKYLQVIDRGESEALVLAKELHANLLLIDESKGRTIATQEGIKVIGLLGVLIEAKSKSLILAVKPIMDELKAKARFRISTELYNAVLKAVGEN